MVGRYSAFEQMSQRIADFGYFGTVCPRYCRVIRLDYGALRTCSLT